MTVILQNRFLSLRFSRQHFGRPADKTEYSALFRDVSPVNTVGWCEPGHPPSMPPHASFDDIDYNYGLRAARQLLKGHFGGRVGYIAAEDLPLFACLYHRSVKRMTRDQQELTELLRTEGPLNIGSIKEITGYPVKKITPVLKRLQEAFILFEDQTDNEGDRAWTVFGDEFPDIDLNEYTKKEALVRILPRFAFRSVFFDEYSIMRFYNQPMKDIREALHELLSARIVSAAISGGQQGYVLSSDIPVLSESVIPPVPSSVIAVQRNDFIVRCAGYKTGSQWDTLYLLLVDGEIHGAVCGRFRFGPHDIEDIILDLPEDEIPRRKNEILDAVYTVFNPGASPYKRFNGIKNSRLES